MCVSLQPFPPQIHRWALAKAIGVMAGWLLMHWEKRITFGVGKVAIAWLWGNNQVTVQTLGYSGEGGGRPGCVVVLQVMLARGAPEKNVQCDAFRPGISFFDCGVLMHHSYIKPSKMHGEEVSSEHVYSDDTVQHKQGLEEPLAVAISNTKNTDPFGSGQCTAHGRKFAPRRWLGLVGATDLHSESCVTWASYTF